MNKEIVTFPKQWKLSNLSEISDINRTTVNPEKAFHATDFYYIDIDSIENETGRIKHTKKYKGHDAPSRARRMVKFDDVIMSTVRPYLKAFAIIPKEHENHICSTGFAVLSPHENINSKYLLYALFSISVINQCKKMMVGAQYPALNESQVKKIKIPFPPLPEQKKIAAILSTVDIAIENVDRGIIKIEKIKKVLTYKLFTYGLRNKGTKTLKIGKIPRDWKISSLSEIAKVRYGLGQPPSKKEKGIPMIRATNIKGGKIFLKNLLFIDPRDIPNSRNPYLKENDIIVVRSGAYTGDVAYITQKWEGSVAGYDLIITPSENINPKYLSLFLLSNKIQKRYFGTLKERSAQPHLNSHQLEMTPIVYPTLVEQKQIAEIISAIELKQELLEKRKLRLLQLKKGLMNDLLTGQKRVRLES